MFKFQTNKFPHQRSFIEKILRRFYLPSPKYYKFRLLSSNNRYEIKIKKKFPIRWFFWETIPDIWHRMVVEPYRSVEDFIRYRTKHRYHLVDTGLKPGYYDTDTRMLHSCFNLFVDYVEIELAAMNLSREADDGTSKTFYETWFQFKRKRIRDASQGIALLDREIQQNNYPGSRNQLFVEKKFLYTWWKVYRPLRSDPYTDPLIWEIDSKTSEAIFKDRYALVDNLADFYEAEDTEMLVRLMNVRSSLWT